MKNNRNRTFRRSRKPKTKYTRKMSGGGWFSSSGTPLNGNQIKYSKVNEISTLINGPNNNIDINAKVDRTDVLPFIFALKEKRYDIVELLLHHPKFENNKENRKLFLNQVLEEGNIALNNNQLELAIQLFLTPKNTLNELIDDKETPLTFAIQKIDDLRKYGFAIDENKKREIGNNCHEFVRLLVSTENFDVNQVNKSGETALHKAIMINSITMAMILLLSKDIDVNILVKGLSPLTNAIYINSRGIAYLIRLNPSIDLTNAKEYFSKPDIKFASIDPLCFDLLLEKTMDELLNLELKYITPQQKAYLNYLTAPPHEDLTEQGGPHPVSGGKRKKHRHTKKHRKSKRAITRR